VRSGLIFQMMDHIVKVSSDTPLQLDKSTDSFTHVYTQASSQSARDSANFQKSVIDYVVEWESITTTLIDEELKENKKLRESFQHYQNKVETLRKKVNTKVKKGKDTPDKEADRLERNADKLKLASSAYETAAKKLKRLIEEAVRHGWKDLYPLIQATLKWDMDRSESEHETYSKLKTSIVRLESAYRGRERTQAESK
jgi:Skp family chaperone for outer membrane proteins